MIHSMDTDLSIDEILARPIVMSDGRNFERREDWSRVQNGTGYVLLYLPNDHPMVKRYPSRGVNRTVNEHVVIMQKMLGRMLLPGESVHHKDGVRNNNQPSNLELWVKPQPAGQRSAEFVRAHCPSCTCGGR